MQLYIEFILISEYNHAMELISRKLYMQWKLLYVAESNTAKPRPSGPYTVTLEEAKQGEGDKTLILICRT